MGHESVRGLLVAHLAEGLPAWLDVARGGDEWPPDPRHVAADDIWPEGDDKWPAVLVPSTRMVKRTSLSADVPAAALFAGRYEVSVAVGCRAVKERDSASASSGRDRLMQAVRWLLLTHPGLDASTSCHFAELSETTQPVALDAKGRPVALGRLVFTVMQTEPVPDLTGVPVVSADVEVDAAAADQPLHTDTGYDADLVYSGGGDYDAGTVWPPKP